MATLQCTSLSAPHAPQPRACRSARSRARPALRSQPAGAGARGTRPVCKAAEKPPPSGNGAPESVEETTRKWGLEAGLWKVFTQKDGSAGGEGGNGQKFTQAKDLLKVYGSAYLVTSISLSIVSFSLSYVLVSAGVDVAGLLEKVGLSVTATSEQVGAFALAYAVHKAASPIRFPPTVALTPLVARWMGKEVKG